MPSAAPTSDRPTSELLRQIATMTETGPVTVGQVFAAAGSRGHALALAVFSLPEALPMPIAGVSAVIAAPLILISAHMLAAGKGNGLPRFVADRKLDGRLISLVCGKAVGVLQRVERLSRPRLAFVVRRERVLAAACLILSIVVALPIPLWNMVPAFCLLLVALGIMQRDGVLALVGLAGAASMVVAASLLTEAVVRWLGGLF